MRVQWIGLVTLLACNDTSLPDPLRGTACPLELVRLVNDQWHAAHPHPGDNLWHRSSYMVGNTVLAAVLDDADYRAYGNHWANIHDFSINDGITTWNADNHCAGQTYLALYERYGEPDALREIQRAMDYTLDGGKRDQWYWIDAQFMASPVLAQMTLVTGDAKYVDGMFEMYADARDRRGLYEPDVGLWYRDENYLYPAHTTERGKRIFWSRGNGWVIGALARTLEYLPADSPYRPEYESMLQSMATALARVQRPDGLWNVSLDDPEDYPGPESSGTSFFTYGIAYGINRGILDRDEFLPIVERAWRGLAEVAIRADGELGYVQGVGEKPASSQPVTLTSTHDYGVGAFLLAGSEVLQLGIDFGCP